MIKDTQLSEYVASVVTKLEAGLKKAKESGCGEYRLRQISFGGEVVFGDHVLAATTTTNEPLADTVVISTETPSTQSQESAETVEQRVQRGGDKIFGNTTTSEE